MTPNPHREAGAALPIAVGLGQVRYILKSIAHGDDQREAAVKAVEIVDCASDTIEELVEGLKEARNYVEACSVYVKEQRGGRGWWTCDQLLANCDALLAKLEAGDTK
jgi:hypothetical protein